MNQQNHYIVEKIILSILLCFGITASALAQSSFLEKGQNGFGISGGYSTNKDLSGFSWGAGFSFSGVFDLGISVGRFGFDQQPPGRDLHATTISPYASYFAIKQDEQMPVSFAVTVSYERQTYSDKTLRNYDMSGNFFSIGASLYRMYEASKDVNIQPGIGFTYITGALKVTDISQPVENTAVFTLGLQFIFHNSPTNILVITPLLGFGDDATTLGVTLSLTRPWLAGGSRS